jgi:hypothetical protein
VNITTEPESPEEPKIPTKRLLPNLLVQGFQLALRNWPFVVWAYAVNLVFGLLAGIPFAAGLAPYLDHSLAAQRIGGTIDLTYLGELAIHLRDTSFFPIAVHAAGWLNLLQLLVLFVLFAGTVFVYVSAEPPRLSVLLRGGVAYFWRFVRAAILVGCVAGLILGVLFAARSALLARASAVFVDRKMFYYSAISGAVILLVALLLRLWFDLVEVYVVRNAMDGERRAHRALLPAFKLLRRYFFRTVGSFFLIGVAGLSALALCLYLWKEFVPAHQVWIACLLAQVGLFLLLASRFWQRGLEVALVMSADPPIVVAEETAAMVEEEDVPAMAGVAGLAGLSEPTLRELVAKLRTEPWANPEATPKPTLPPAPAIDAAPGSISTPTPHPLRGNEPSVSPFDRHAAKFPLGGLGPETEAAATTPADRVKSVDDKDWPPPPPRTGKPLA